MTYEFFEEIELWFVGSPSKTVTFDFSFTTVDKSVLGQRKLYAHCTIKSLVIIKWSYDIVVRNFLLPLVSKFFWSTNCVWVSLMKLS